MEIIFHCVVVFFFTIIGIKSFSAIFKVRTIEDLLKLNPKLEDQLKDPRLQAFPNMEKTLLQLHKIFSVFWFIVSVSILMYILVPYLGL